MPAIGIRATGELGVGRRGVRNGGARRRSTAGGGGGGHVSGVGSLLGELLRELLGILDELLAVRGELLRQVRTQRVLGLRVVD